MKMNIIATAAAIHLLFFVTATTTTTTAKEVDAAAIKKKDHHSFLRRELEVGSFAVMSRNLYFGAALTPVILATTPEEFGLAISNAFFQALGDLGTTSLGSNPWARMDAVAGEIADNGAILVGLQETAIYSVNGNVVADFAQLLIDALKTRGMTYEVIVDQKGLAFTAPVGNNIATLEVGDVIIARTDALPDGQTLELSNRQFGVYNVSSTIPSPLGDIPFLRQWVSVDAVMNKDLEFRFISTHLEPFIAPVRASQAKELIDSPAFALQTTDGPIILVGDFNSEVSASGDAVDLFLQDNFTDVWESVGSGPGFTHGHDADLADPSVVFDTRIDFVLYRGQEKMTVKEASVVDAELALVENTTRPLWASDHGGVVALMEITETEDSPADSGAFHCFAFKNNYIGPVLLWIGSFAMVYY